MKLIDTINPQYEKRINEFRNYIYFKALKRGDDLMPCDIAQMMMTAQNAGKYKNLLFNGFKNIYGKLLMLIDIYEGCGFFMPEESKELNLNNIDYYFK